MRLEGGKLAVFVVLVVAGLYLALDHTPPFPLNHESIGLGAYHIVHAAAGVLLLIGASYLWYKG
ncbi:MAG: hypothetical protein HYS81_03310 [Candidatus Aenigmatarchaeota archaeon]|nr:MAG: hypothetical protein HYS81_03310 [Candidatus Aenigmarchaeota archaeon]